MNLNKEELKALIKEGVNEALVDFFENKEMPPIKSSTQKKEATEAQDQDIPSYEELFHRIMAQVARGSIDTQTAGQLLSEAYQAFGTNNDSPPPKNMNETPEEKSSATHDILMKIARWESELSNITGEAAESTLEMMERMKSKIIQTTEKIKNEKEEAEMYATSEKIEKEEQEKRRAEKIKKMKDDLASGKK